MLVRVRHPITKHELLLVLLQELYRSLHIHKQPVDFADVLHVDFSRLALLGDEVGGSDQVDSVTQRALLRNFGQQFRRLLRQLNIFLLAANLKDLGQLFVAVGLRGDDQGTV